MTRRVFVVLFILGVLLRVYMINVPPLWYDENFTLLLARSSFSAMLAATMGDVHPPLWYIIEWSIFHIAPNAPAWVIRLPALAFSIASLPLFVMIMYRLQIPHKVQNAALLMMAILPFQLWYAQEGRMYAMLEFLCLFSLLAAMNRQYVLLFIGSLCLLYTQNYGPLYLAAIALVMFFREREIVFNGTLGTMAGAGVLWMPWVSVIMGQARGISGNYWITAENTGSVLTILYKLFLSSSVPEAFYFASYIVTFAAVIVGGISFMRSHHPARLTIAIMALVPILIAALISVTWQPILLFRPLIGISPFVYIITAWSFDNGTIAHRSNKVQSIYPGIARSAE